MSRLTKSKKLFLESIQILATGIEERVLKNGKSVQVFASQPIAQIPAMALNFALVAAGIRPATLESDNEQIRRVADLYDLKWISPYNPASRSSLTAFMEAWWSQLGPRGQSHSLFYSSSLLIFSDNFSWRAPMTEEMVGEALGYMCAGEMDIPGDKLYYRLEMRIIFETGKSREKLQGTLYIQGCDHLGNKRKDRFMEEVIAVQQFIDDNDLPVGPVIGTIRKSVRGTLVDTDYYTYE